MKILQIDPWLKPYENDLKLRMEHYKTTRRSLTPGTLSDFANGHKYFGFHPTEEGWYYREWAPEAEALFLIGDFNDWNRSSHPLTKKDDGVWEIFVPGRDTLKHLPRVKVSVVSKGQYKDKIPLYIKKVKQNRETHDFSGYVVDEDNFRWEDEGFKPTEPLFVYECHIGMAQEEGKIGSYTEFNEKILPWVHSSGYNALQIMAIMEHPYYASFGYQVSNFFAASSWFGEPHELKELINAAHKMGIVVLLDVVHSHAAVNTAEGINEFDGTEYQFFHVGQRGQHPAWGTKLFDYGKPQVIHFLLSNIKFWLEEYHFDGFRFDGVTSMLYHHQGLGVAFDSYDKYFSMSTDLDAVTYLQLANELVREINPSAVTIAEDMSGMPGMCLPINYGGIGFDYRLSMGVPDLWIRLLKSVKDEDWSMNAIWYELIGRRPSEKNICYCESHDQALVGDKTIMFWLADAEMYYGMSKSSKSIIIDRAIALHKMIRLVTISLAGEGYLNFIGNEFGHPEWIDFPREGNNESFHYSRRQWSLVHNHDLRYEQLYKFDNAMLSLFKNHPVFGSEPTQLWLDENKKLIIFRKAELVFIFNFHPTASYPELCFPVHRTGRYKVELSTDDPEFGGNNHDLTIYETFLNCDDSCIKIYSPSRTAIVLKKI